MKTRFKYKFKKYAYMLMAAAILLAIAVIVINLLRIVKYGYDSSKLMSIIISCVLSVVIMVLVVSMLVSSFYEVSEKSFTLRWGILKNEIPVKEITKVLHNPDKNTLSVFYGENDNFMVISAIDVNVLDIVDAIRKYNKKVIYESISEENK